MGACVYVLLLVRLVRLLLVRQALPGQQLML
jgi:hypothetical protein